MTREDDSILLRRYADAGAEDAFAELMRRNLDAVYSAARRRVGGDAHLAADVAQEVFLTVARHAGQLSRHPVLAGWLHTATRNAAANVVRREIRRRQREQEAQIMQEIASDRERDADWHQVAPVLDAVIDELGERDRIAVLLRFFDRRTFSEIGSVLQLSEDAARMRVERALDRLRGRLVHRGIRSSAAALGAVLTQYTVTAAPSGLAARTAAALAANVPAGGVGLGLKGFSAQIGAGELTIGFAAVALLLVAIGTSVAGYRTNRRAEVTLAIERQTIGQLEGRLREVEAQVRHSVPERAVSRVHPAAPDRPASDRTTGIAAIYDAFYRSSSLTPAQIKQFEALRLQGAGNGEWVFERPASKPAPGAPSRAHLSTEEMEQQLHLLLGDDGYARYQDYNRMLPARTIATELASEVLLTEPLGREQAEQFTQIVANASAAYRHGGTTDRTSLYWDAIRTEASRILSPQQLTALRDVQQYEAFREAMLRRLAGSLDSPDAAP